MASNGLIEIAKTGTCRMCLRARKTYKYLKTVGEVRHGYATGHIWECVDIDDCDKVASKKLSSEICPTKKYKIKTAKETGRWKNYRYYN